MVCGKCDKCQAHCNCSCIECEECDEIIECGGEIDDTIDEDDRKEKENE